MCCVCLLSPGAHIPTLSLVAFVFPEATRVYACAHAEVRTVVCGDPLFAGYDVQGDAPLAVMV